MTLNQQSFYCICGPVMWEHDTPAALKQAIKRTRSFSSRDNYFQYLQAHPDYEGIKFSCAKTARRRKEHLPVMVSDLFLNPTDDSTMHPYLTSGSHRLLQFDQLLLSLYQMLKLSNPNTDSLNHQFLHYNKCASHSPGEYIHACRQFNRASYIPLLNIQKRATVLSQLSISAVVQTRDSPWQTRDSLGWSVLLSARSMLWKSCKEENDTTEFSLTSSLSPFRALHNALLYLHVYCQIHGTPVHIEPLCVCLIELFVLSITEFVIRMKASTFPDYDVDLLTDHWLQSIAKLLETICPIPTVDIFQNLHWSELNQCVSRIRACWENVCVIDQQLSQTWLSFSSLNVNDQEQLINMFHTNHLNTLIEMGQRIPKGCKYNACEDHIQSLIAASPNNEPTLLLLLHSHHFGCQSCNEEISDFHNYRLYQCTSGCCIRYHQSCLRRLGSIPEQCINCDSSYMHWEFYRQTICVKQEMLLLNVLPLKSKSNPQKETIQSTIIEPSDVSNPPVTSTTIALRIKLSPSQFAQQKAQEVKRAEIRALQQQPQSWNDEKCLELIQSTNTFELNNRKVTIPEEIIPHPALELERKKKKSAANKIIKGSLDQLNDLLSSIIIQ
jgi:hypothetical protein